MGVQTQFQFRRGTAAQWTTANPILAAGEIGFESDTNQFKIGTGSTGWAQLPYGAISAAGSATITNKVLSGNTLSSSLESINIVASAATGTVPFYTNVGTVYYYTSNASANWTFNFTGALNSQLNTIMSIGQSITAVFLNTNGSSAYYPNAFQVDGTTSGVTVKWQGGSAPTSGNVSSIDAYSFTIIKTANATFTILASQSKFA
jgi:Major tropism determinant N-terminal domain